jgi:hypothetical protein
MHVCTSERHYAGRERGRLALEALGKTLELRPRLDPKEEAPAFAGAVLVAVLLAYACSWSQSRFTSGHNSAAHAPTKRVKVRYRFINSRCAAELSLSSV